MNASTTLKGHIKGLIDQGNGNTNATYVIDGSKGRKSLWIILSQPGNSKVTKISNLSSKDFSALLKDYNVFARSVMTSKQPKRERKETNPKDIVGTKKTPLSVLPFQVLWRVGLAMLEGALKYGRHNYRGVGVRASVYFDSTMRHLGCWWEGEDIDPGSNLNHIDKAIAGLMVLRDSMIRGNFEDDRPPKQLTNMVELDSHVDSLFERYGDINPKHWTELNKDD